MALVGNISGSTGVASTVGVTGSVIFANRPGSLFPGLPGNDVAFFVSGNIAARSPGSPAATPDYTVRGTTVIGGDLVVSGTLFGGSPLYIGDQIIARNGLVVTGTLQSTAGLSGSLTKLADGTSYLIAGSNVTITTGSNGAVTIASTATGGGGSGGPFTEASNVAAYTTSSIAIGHGAAASNKGADLFFFVSGSTVDGSNNALFGGQVISSGSVKVKNTGGGVAVSISNSGVISGSSDLQAGGNLTVEGTSTLTGNVTFGGNIVADAEEAKSIFVNVGANNITIGGTSGNVVIGNDLQVDGNDIKMNGGTTAITFSGAGDVAVAGDLTVTGNDIKSSTATALTLAGANVTAAGDLTVTGDLTVNGTTTTVNTNYLLVEDPTIYLANGSVTSNQDGGIAIASGSSVAGQALVWGRVAQDTWGAGRLDVRTGSVTDLTPMSLLPVRASKFEVGGASAFLTSSNGSALTASVAASNPINFSFGGTSFAEILESGVDAKFGASGNKNLILSGTQITMVAGNNGTLFQRDTNIIGAVSGIASTNMTVAARGPNAGSGPTTLILTGSGIQLGANATTVDFIFGTSGRGVASNANGFTIGSQGGVNLNLSGSSNFLMRHGATGVGFQQHSLPYLTINSGSIALSTNTALITADTGKALLIGGALTTVVSGSDVFLDAGANGVTLRKDSTSFAQISSPASNTFTIAPAATFTTANVVNTVATTVNFAGFASTLLNMGNTAGSTVISGSVTMPGSLSVQGSVTLGDASGDNITFNGSAASHLIPNANNTFDLGSPALRWRNMYTGDLHLRNDRGDWTIIEERDFLSITNNHTGRRYKFVMQEI